MTPFARLFCLLIALATLPVVGVGQAHAQQVKAQAPVKVSVRKPLVLTHLQSLDFGTVILSGGSAADTFTISRTGLLTCASGATCTGTPTAARYNVTGSNQMAVTITAPDFDLVNGAGHAVRFYPDAPGTVNLPNSGNQGIEFGIGGRITVPQTASGAYVGTMTVTAEYQ